MSRQFAHEDPTRLQIKTRDCIQKDSEKLSKLLGRHKPDAVESILSFSNVHSLSPPSRYYKTDIAVANLARVVLNANDIPSLLAFDKKSPDSVKIDVILHWHRKLWHLGINRLWKLMRLTCANSFTRQLVERAVRSCEECTATRTLMPENSIGKIELPNRPSICIEIDHFTPSSTHDERGYETVLTIKDRFSKLICAVPCYSHDHLEVCDHLSTYMQTNGIPIECKADNAFLHSGPYTEFMENFGIRTTFSPAYRPCANAYMF